MKVSSYGAAHPASPISKARTTLERFGSLNSLRFFQGDRLSWSLRSYRVLLAEYKPVSPNGFNPASR